jgi:3-deoxy-manno-octulosonate cytidylyltransferase (CMP-KDO synthetase)
LAEIAGKSMIQRVYEQSVKSKSLDKVIVATDDSRIAQHVTGFGGEAVMTGANHASGTDRCSEALGHTKKSYQYIINIQGDEPFIEPGQIDELAAALDGEVEIATQMIPVKTREELLDPGEAKIVLNENSEAMYFSRSPIPYIRNAREEDWHLHPIFYRQVGMYAYRSDILAKITKLPVSSLEQAESLEQLRWLQHGFKIKCLLTSYESHCVDAPEDIERVLQFRK